MALNKNLYPWSGKQQQDPLVSKVLAQSNETNAQISRRTGLASGTIKRWRDKKTLRPNISSLRVFLRMAGKDLGVIDKD